MGYFHRRIVIVNRRPSCGAGGGHGGGEVDDGTRQVRAALEDDYHHFRVDLRHDGARVLRIDGQALRHPYSLCPSAVTPLQQLLGMPLDAVASSVSRVTDASLQCTHLLDLAGLAIAAAAAGVPRREYMVAVSDPVGGVAAAELRRDGRLLFTWELHGMTIRAPTRFAGVSLLQGLARWALDHLDAAEAEAAIVLRRGAVISRGRQFALDEQVHAQPTGRCHVQQPGRAERALRVVGSTLDFTGRADELCVADAAWLGVDGDHGAAG